MCGQPAGDEPGESHPPRVHRPHVSSESPPEPPAALNVAARCCPKCGSPPEPAAALDSRPTVPTPRAGPSRGGARPSPRISCRRRSSSRPSGRPPGRGPPSCCRTSPARSAREMDDRVTTPAPGRAAQLRPQQLRAGPEEAGAERLSGGPPRHPHGAAAPADLPRGPALRGGYQSFWCSSHPLFHEEE